MRMETQILTPVAKRNVILLVLAQSFLGAQMPIFFTLSGLAGLSMASNACFATLPITMIVLGNVVAATPLSAFMHRFGRRIGFITGAGFGCLGAFTSAYAVYEQSFYLLLLGSFCTGIYASAQAFYRFAAADAVPPWFQPKAISYVLAGGLIAAIIGPQLVKLTVDAMVFPFLGAYLAAIAINLSGCLLFLFLDIPRAHDIHHDAPKGRSRIELLKTPVIAVSIICGMVSYALMTLVMTSTPLAVVGCGFETSNAANIVSAHVLAMYGPSFFTGHLIARLGAVPVISVGLAILASAGMVSMTGVELEQFYIALILLGVGWNFGYIGSTTMLAASYEPAERGRAQGLNDMLVFGGVALASLASGGLMNCSGGDAEAGWQSVNLAMIPFLTLAGAALIWLVLRPGRVAD